MTKWDSTCGSEGISTTVTDADMAVATSATATGTCVDNDQVYNKYKTDEEELQA
jgi:hypothetical protein